MSAPIPERLKPQYVCAEFFGEPACSEYRKLIEELAEREQLIRDLISAMAHGDTESSAWAELNCRAEELLK